MTREDAIKHLENMKWLKGYSNTTVDGVPIGNVIDGIIALLKEQEPRVMTLDEVLALPYDTPIYIENCDDLCGWDIFSGITKDDDNYVVTGALWSTAEYWPQEEYGDTWRCWTYRSTDEQRKAVKWG